jgi:hypothetical protein
MHREAEIGSLEPGKLADFTVLARNPLRLSKEWLYRRIKFGDISILLCGIHIAASA